MKPTHKQVVIRIALAAAALFGGTPGAITAQLPTVPPDGLAKSGTDGVGGIEKKPPLGPQISSPNQGTTGQQGGGSPNGGSGTSVWIDLGDGLPGSKGLPDLSGAGSGVPGTPVTLTLQNGRAGAAATLVIGLHAAPVPFKGGALVPSPDLLVFGLPVDGEGSLELSAQLPAALPSGLTVCLQLWLPDAGGAKGFAASNGLELLVP